MATDNIRDYVQWVTGAGEATRARAVEVAQGLLGLVERATPAEMATQASALADDLLSAARANRDMIAEVVRDEVASLLETSSNIVRSQEFDRVRARLSQVTDDVEGLRRQVMQLTGLDSSSSAQPVPPRPTRAATTGSATRRTSTRPGPATRRRKVAPATGDQNAVPQAVSAGTTPTETTAKKTATKRAAKKTTATEVTAKKTAADTSAAMTSTATTSAAKTSAAKKSTDTTSAATTSAAKKPAAKKSAATKSTGRKSTAATRTAARKTTAKKSTAKKTATTTPAPATEPAKTPEPTKPTDS